MSGYTKLFSNILTSSIWQEDHATLRVWITFLALANAEGVVEGSVPGIAHTAKVTRDEAEYAISVFSSPDRDSRSPKEEGRRIEKIQGGWRIINYVEYRNKLQQKPGSNAPYAKAHRDRKRNGSNGA